MNCTSNIELTHTMSQQMFTDRPSPQKSAVKVAETSVILKNEQMSLKTKCPKCQEEFFTKKHLKSGVRFELSSIKYVLRNLTFPWNDGLEGIYKPDLVVCPKCENEFNSKGYKYFGFIDPKHFQIGLVIIVAIYIFVFLSFMIWNSFK